jgi:GNAT superfamily N-acetyltransferase
VSYGPYCSRVAEIREIGAEDLEAFAAVMDAVFPREDITIEGLVDWRRQAEDMAWFLADGGAGFALVGWHTPPGHAIAGVGVLPARRGKGLGDEILHAAETWAQTRGATQLEGGIAEDDEATIAWAAARGFEEVGRNSRMVLDLTAIDVPDATPPPGVEIVTWAERPELARGLWEVAREAGRDIPGEEDTDAGPLEEWLDRDMRGSSDHPEAVFVALEGDEVLGYAKLSFTAERTDRAYHDLTGVRRAHRGRGIAAVLKATQIAWAKTNGYESLQTANEVRNAPIRHLNQKHGYVLEPGNVIVRRAIAGS